MNDKTEITPEALLGRYMHGASDAQLPVIAAAALLIREGLDNIVEAIDRQRPPE